MKTPLSVLPMAAISCALSAQPLNLDHFLVDVQNEVSVNSKHSEFGMVKSVGGEYMFTSDRNKFNERNEFLDESSYKLYSCNPKAAYRSVRPMDVNFNEDNNNGPATPVINNEFYFTSTNRKATLNWKEATKTNMLTINKATLEEGVWKVGVIKEFKSTKYSFGQPSISRDGKTLFFVSDMDGGQGESDIYVSYLTEEGWTAPENLGSVVNSSKKDQFPYFHESGILFFATEGHGGFGGLDLFMTYRTNDGWAKPENLGSPVNTPYDDFSLYLEGDLNTGYFASNREGGMGGDDIYRINLTGIGAVQPLAISGEEMDYPADEEGVTEIRLDGNGIAAATPDVTAASGAAERR